MPVDVGVAARVTSAKMMLIPVGVSTGVRPEFRFLQAQPGALGPPYPNQPAPGILSRSESLPRGRVWNVAHDHDVISFVFALSISPRFLDLLTGSGCVKFRGARPALRGEVAMAVPLQLAIGERGPGLAARCIYCRCWPGPWIGYRWGAYTHVYCTRSLYGVST